jgi:carbonic anhydrase/acetyltransferase-like protein (isoleucine patch superfamily)
VIVEHAGKAPNIDPTAYVAPNAVVSGDVWVGPGARVLFGAVLTAEAGGRIELERDAIVMEQALVRGRAGHDVHIGAGALIGPHAHVNGCRIGQSAFVATGASIFPGARMGARSALRIGAVLHVNSSLPEGDFVPIGWVAVGDPAEKFPPERHDEIWAVQKELGFVTTVMGAAPGTPLHEAMQGYADKFSAHRDDRVIEP